MRMADGVLQRLLDGLREGRDLRDAEYSAFSDLTRSDVRSVNEQWGSVPTATRALLLERAFELMEVNVELQFEALARMALSDPEAEVRERAVALLWESTDRDVAAALARLATDDPGPGVRAAAAAGLSPFVEAHLFDRLPKASGELIVSALQRALRDSDVDVRARAIESAAGFPDPWAQEAILEAYEGGEEVLRLSAIRAMGVSGLTRWEEYIEEELLSGNPEVRFEAILAAGSLGSPLLIEPLGELLNDEDPEVVLAAIEAIGEIGGDDAITLLDEFAPHAPEGFEEAIANARTVATEDGMFRRFGELDSFGTNDEDDDE